MKISFFRISALILLAAGFLGASGAPNEANTKNSDAHELLLPTRSGLVSITPLNDNIFRINLFKSGKPEAMPLSQAQALQAANVATTTTRLPGKVEISTSTTKIVVDEQTGLLSFFNASGAPLLSEEKSINNSGASKSVSFIPASSSEDFYGAGERGHSLRLNGDTLVMYNRQNYGYTADDPRIKQMNITVPWFVSSKGYGVLFDDYAKASLILNDSSIAYSSTTNKPLSYFFINGNGSLAGTIAQYTLLTGRQQLPPLWTLGYITSKYGYHTQAETMGVVDTLKSRGYPLDGVVLDLYWYGKETDMGRLEWNRTQWPDHKKMLADLDSMGVKMVLISQPYINKIGALDNYNMLKEQGMLVKDSAGNVHDVTTWVGDAGMFDVSNPATRDWLWNRYKQLTDEGVAAWWGDLGEPEVHPVGMLHANGESTEQYHNVYGNEWSRIIHEGFKKDYPDRRNMILMRGGTAGLQRYNVFPWSTDVSRSWGGFQPQVNIMLNSGLSGLGYMSSDIGGFAVDPEHPVDAELYLRWLQMGAFTPTLRTHAQDRPEPYHYPEIEETAKRFIKMRYEWLPYNYTLAYENASQGLPFARPLNFHGDNADERYANLHDEYLWGDEVLIAPVMHPGMLSRKVSFPAGDWYNFNHPSETPYKGGTIVTVEAPLEELPIFVRAGSFIPLYMRPIANTSDYDPSSLTVKYYPSAQWSNYTLFDDDRKSTRSLEDGKYRLTTFSGKSDKKGTTIEFNAEGTYAGAPDIQMLTFEIEACAKKPKSVEISGIPGIKKIKEAASPKAIRQYGWSYDEATRTLTIKLTWNFSKTVISLR